MKRHNGEALLAVLALLVASISPACSFQQNTFNIGGGGSAAKNQPSSSAAGGGSSFDQFLAKNVEHYAVSEQIYASKAKVVPGGKALLDAELSAAEASTVRYVVSPDSKGKFRTVSEAVKAVPERNKQRVILDIRPGTYKEKVLIPSTKPFITLSSNPMNPAIITWDDRAGTRGKDGATGRKKGFYIDPLVPKVSEPRLNGSLVAVRQENRDQLSRTSLLGRQLGDRGSLVAVGLANHD